MPFPDYELFDTGRITVRGYVEEKKIQAHLTALYFTEVNSPMGALSPPGPSPCRTGRR